MVNLFLLCAAPLSAATINANPADYSAKVAALNPGDVLQLAAGTYTNRLVINGLHGTAGGWITIQGPATGTATFNGVAGNNTVSLRDCSFIAIKGITVDCLGLAVDGIKAEGYTTTPHTVHDMLIENVRILNAGANQQIVGINTKCPCWNWTIRGCEIIGAGTGMYLGNSDGNQPFIRGVIEGNRVYDPEGYCIEIKHQNNWPTGLGLPTGDGRTILRNNVFIKTSRASGSGDRPNLLVSGFPDSGDGSNDVYEIYGNFIANNPRESLIQACGRLSIHDNILVDAPDANFAGIYIKNHQGKTLKVVHVYNNTVYAAARGIRIVEQPSVAHSVQGNLVFSANSISAGFSGLNESNNLTDTVANAGNYVNSPATGGAMDFYPKAGQCTGAALNMSAYTGDTHYDLDFNGDSKGAFTYRGAYAGSGTNPGWALGNTLKTGGPGAGPTTPPALSVASPAGGSLPGATEGVSYSVTFTAAGGAAPYSWNIPAVDLPPGLALNTGSGVLSGVPTTVGPYSFTVSVMDNNSDTAVQNYTLQVSTPSAGGNSGGGGGCSAGGGSAWWLLVLFGAAGLACVSRRSRT
ncbi:MAG: putative Ig domain-containing protein [Planctomycetes bacterium]|nr:putative Ig domain-containing protein [Planctomycetota bacterium]MCB9936298.1 putative Ig domain-containing protein [Planctomycetota bacterium]